MPISDYLTQKYGFYPNATMPIEMIADELHIEPAQVKRLVISFVGKRHAPKFIDFSMFIAICSQVLER